MNTKIILNSSLDTIELNDAYNLPVLNKDVHLVDSQIYRINIEYGWQYIYVYTNSNVEKIKHGLEEFKMN